MPILLTLEMVIMGATTNLTQVLLCVMLNIGIDKGYVFTIVCNGITTHIKCDIGPLVIPIHCVVHRVDLVVKLILST
jgi:hypothetical protein